MKQILILQSVPKSLNVLFGMHHQKRAKYKTDVEMEVWIECKGQKIKPIKNPAILQYILTFGKKRNRDVDNYIGGTKYINDGLRKAGIIPEDNSEVITAINLTFKQGEYNKTELIIQEIV